MITKKIIYVGLIIAFGCSSKPEEVKLEGHWHSCPIDYATYQTIDINDSVTSTNKYIIDGRLRDDYPRVNKLGVPVLPLDFYSFSEKFEIRNDTLIVSDSSSIFKYVKSKLEDCLVTDRYITSSIEVSLNEFDSAEDFNTSY